MQFSQLLRKDATVTSDDSDSSFEASNDVVLRSAVTNDDEEADRCKVGAVGGLGGGSKGRSHSSAISFPEDLFRTIPC